MFQTIAKHAQASGLYAGVGGESKIFMIMLAARELGISPMLALNGGIWNIQGKIEVSARLMNGMIRRGGHDLEITGDDTYCKIIGKRADTGKTHEEVFTIEMAAKAGLSGSNVWKKYPADMLYNRCMSRLARRLFPDVIGTAYVEGEVRESREVEESEKNLDLAQCEDVTPKKETVEEPRQIKIDHLSIDKPTEEVRVLPHQAQELEEKMKKCTKEWHENYFKYMKEKWNATNIEQLPASAYDVTITSINRNIEMRKLQEESANGIV